MITDQMIGQAAHEIATKSPEEIERNTALTWGSRALAAWRKGKAIDPNKSNQAAEAKFELALYAHHCKGEALEHAALAEGYDMTGLLQQLREVP